MKKLLTLVLIDDGSSLLLGMKKRGFGEGRWNGFGGKVEADETILEAAKREVEEEVGVQVSDLVQVATLLFSFASDEALVLEVHVFRATAFSGTPIETEEMKPQWFLYDEIPYDEMWPDDRYWLPQVLAGETLTGSFHFDAPASSTHQATILTYKIEDVVTSLDGVY
jgi:8-oxo-dGTP diphosphatase / 2-hydroxy-dATP diphosphatase